MGQIIIEIPQNISRKFRLAAHDSAEEILSNIENSIAQSNFLEDDEILNLLADRNESALDVAAEMRRSWKRKI